MDTTQEMRPIPALPAGHGRGKHRHDRDAPVADLTKAHPELADNELVAGLARSS
jgi:hypothetical protein